MLIRITIDQREIERYVVWKFMIDGLIMVMIYGLTSTLDNKFDIIISN